MPIYTNLPTNPAFTYMQWWSGIRKECWTRMLAVALVWVWAPMGRCDTSTGCSPSVWAQRQREYPTPAWVIRILAIPPTPCLFLVLWPWKRSGNRGWGFCECAVGRLIPEDGFVSVDLGHCVQVRCFEHQDSPQTWLTNSVNHSFSKQSWIKEST